MKQLFFLATLWLSVVGQLAAQQEIDIYALEHIPKSVSEWGLYGPVKSVKFTDLFLKGDTVREEGNFILKYNRIGQLIEMTNDYFIKDPRIHYYTYDSLNRFESHYISDGTFSERAVYDSLGRFSHSVYTRQNEGQLFYDGELSSTRYYEYDAQNRVQKITYYDKDGNTSMTIINQYDQFGNLIESTRECWKQGGKSEFSTHLTYEIEYWE